MRSFGTKLAGLLVAGSLVLTGIAGCGNSAPAVNNTQELLALYEKDANKDNYHMDLTMDMSMDLMGQSITMPMTGSYDSAGDNVHGTLSMDMSALGIDSVKAEQYVEKTDAGYFQYMSPDGETWTKSAVEDAGITGKLTSADLLKDATFAKTDAGYELTLPGDKMLSAISSVMGSTNEMLDPNDPTTAEALKNSTSRFTFDKNAQLTGINFSLNISSGDGSDTYGITASVKLNLDCKMSNYGKVDAKSVTVPEAVKSAAIDTDQAAALVTSLGSGELFGQVEESAASAAATSATSADATSAATTSADATSAAATSAEATSAAATSAEATSAAATSAEATSAAA